jgi:hypothetical protein
MQYEIQNQSKDSPVMKLSSIATLAEKVIATIIFVLLVTVLSIPDYPVTNQQTQQNKTEVTASINHHSPVVN